MDLFDLVRAAPPPPSVREATAAKPEAEAGADADPKEKPSTPSPLPISPIFNPEVESDTEIALPRSPVPASPIYNLAVEDDKAIVDDTAADDNATSRQPTLDSDNKEDDNADRDGDADGEEEDDEHPQPQPPKTKAQQKMFADVPTTSKNKVGTSAGIRQCLVRIKRLNQSEIERLIKRKANKRGRPRKSASDSSMLDDSPSPPKKQKPINKVHIKVPWMQNGAKQRATQTTSRAHTPPPNLKRSLKQDRPNSVSKALVQRYGARFFKCVVKLKRLTGADTSTPKRANRKSKSKLSVSFSEAVEILGSKPRKSSSIAGTPRLLSKLCNSVPTRLQRVDATGNVLEDIELKHDLVLGSASSSTSPSKRSGRPSSCNGGRRATKLKRPALRVPVNDLASLRIDDSQEEEDVDNEAGDEYIVPNEMPVYQTLGVRRSGTPTPVKRVTVTTTVSDEEGTEGPEQEPEPVPVPVPESDADKAAAPAEKPQSQAENEETAEQEHEQKQTDPEPQPKDDDPKPVDPVPKPVEKEAEPKQSADVLEQILSKEKSPVSTALADDVTTDDILEIQTSIEDVRELHTPPSRQNTPQLLPQTPNRSVRFESPESDTSFKSAHEQETSSAAQNTSEEAPARQTSESETVDTELTPPVAATTFNASEPASGTSSIPQPPYSPIAEIPTLDDDELGQLVEPDFQISNSLHSNSRVTMEDILTVFES
ncbi:titin [Drosophila montana]|uniref:titin n=1 Tax=Drosophila montana TaxID=40370 RepID=UPI00313B1C76